LISVRSEVQIFPGPPFPHIAGLRCRFASLRGAIAQLGERLLCKQEVVGSIPSGSTSGDPVGIVLSCSSVRNEIRACRMLLHEACAGRVLSDIVKRRSFRANGTVVSNLTVRDRQDRSARSYRRVCDQGLHPSAEAARMLSRRSLTAVAVGSILKQSWSF
jgi:hypothetical protein